MPDLTLWASTSPNWAAWAACGPREIAQQPAMLRETQAVLTANRAEIEAFLKPPWPCPPCASS